MSRKAKALEFVDQGYNIQITGRHVEITNAMKDYALEKVSKIEKFTHRIIDINVIMDIQRTDHRAEIIVKFDHSKIRSHASSSDMYASIDLAVAKLEKQIRKYKDKLRDHHAKGHADIEMNVNVLRRPQAEDEEDVLEEMEINLENAEPESTLAFAGPHAIIKQETLPLKTLTYDEAIMKMELSGDPFLIFKCEEDQRLKVIYRRNDKNYGIIEPTCGP